MTDVAALTLDSVGPDPLEEFQRWFTAGLDGVRDPDAVALATASREGVPSVRMVLLRAIEPTRVGWFTNYDSHKGHDLNENPRAALLWYRESQGRQVRLEGDVVPMSAEDSDSYFRSRPRGHQLSASASEQSRPLESRRVLEARVRDLDQQFVGTPVPRPEHWGGYWLTPVVVEFWQHRADRLHDRVQFLRSTSGWSKRLLNP